jgi:hypothetical protein
MNALAYSLPACLHEACRDGPRHCRPTALVAFPLVAAVVNWPIQLWAI